MYLSVAPLVLSWSGHDGAAERVHAGFEDLIMSAYLDLLVRLDKTDKTGTGNLAALAAHLERDRLLRVFTDPEVSYRLLWPRRHVVAETADFLSSALRVALEEEAGASPASNLVADFDSPAARFVDLEGTVPRLSLPQVTLSPEEQRMVTAKTESALAGIRVVSQEVDDFVRRFTKSLVVLPDPNAPSRFSSGSTGQFIGRTALANAHLTKVTPGMVAEALVHEAIHSYLYMGEQRERWLLDAELYHNTETIESPWTGARLNLRPFLQACFVWYGLLHFWSRAVGTAVFPMTEMRERLLQSSSGFLGQSLLDRIETSSDRLAPELKKAIAEMQESVQVVFTEQLVS